MLVAGLITGFIGGWHDASESRAAASRFFGNVTHALYVAVQYLLQNGDSEKAGLWLRITQLCGISAVAIVGYEIVARLFGDSLRLMRLRFKRGHTIICGLGRIGSELAYELAKSKRHVVGVEIDPSNLAIDEVRQFGGIVVEADVLSEGILHWLRPQQAKEVFVVTGSDERNLEYVAKLIAMLDENGPDIYTHLDHIELRHLLPNFAAGTPGDATGGAGPLGPEKLHAFNVTDRAIQELLDTHLLDSRPTGDEVAHFVIVGFGDVGQRLLLALANLAHYENRKRSRVTVVYNAAEQDAVNAFQETCSRLFHVPAPDDDPWRPSPTRDDWHDGVEVATVGRYTPGDRGITFVANGGYVRHRGDVACDRFVSNIVTAAVEPNVRLSVFLARDVEPHNCTAAVELRNDLLARFEDRSPTRPVTIYPFVPHRRSLANSIRQADTDVRLVPFGVCREVCTYADITDNLSFGLAAVIGEQYERDNQNAGTSGQEPSVLTTSNDRAAWKRHSDRCAALHAPCKFRAAGVVVNRASDEKNTTAPRPTPVEIDPSAFSGPLIAEMEHNRYVAERLVSGWVFGDPDDDSIPGRRVRLTLVPFDRTARHEQRKDESQLNAMIGFIRRNGYACYASDDPEAV